MEVFDGPLDLLLEEVRRQNVAVEQIAMAPLVARYLAYMRAAAASNWQLDMEWLHMAATLIEWKSRALLPRPPEADTIRDHVIDRLIAHKQQAAGELSRRHALEQGRFSRPPDARIPEGHEEAEFVSVWDLLQQARDLAKWASRQRWERQVWGVTLELEPDDVPIAAMIEELESRLGAAGGCLDLTEALAGEFSQSRQMALFLGALEMVRGERAEVFQDLPFGRIALAAKRRE